MVKRKEYSSTYRVYIRRKDTRGSGVSGVKAYGRGVTVRQNIRIRKDERSMTAMRGNAWECGKTKEPKSIAMTGKTITPYIP